jgi:hypothetical protein
LRRAHLSSSDPWNYHSIGAVSGGASLHCDAGDHAGLYCRAHRRAVVKAVWVRNNRQHAGQPLLKEREIVAYLRNLFDVWQQRERGMGDRVHAELDAVIAREGDELPEIE